MADGRDNHASAADLEERISALEAQLAAVRRSVVTEGIVVVDAEGRERLVARADGPAVELRLALSSSERGRSTELVLFAVDGRDGLAGGLGVQLWVDGTVAREMSCWEDEELPSDPRRRG